MQKAMAMDVKKNDQQKISQHNECKNNSTRCTILSSYDILMSTSNVKQKGDNSWQANSNNHNLLMRYPHLLMRSQTDTPFLLPFP